MAKAIKDKIFDFAYHEALNDATLQKAYSGNKENIKGNKEVKKLVKEYIESAVEGTCSDLYDVAEKVCSKIADNEFTFGNAQKLINMTAKYIYIAAFLKEDIPEGFKILHCPMDSKMISIVVAKYRDAVSKGNAKKEDLMLPDGSECWSSVSWSKISDVPEKRINNITTYIKYQSMVKYLAENTCYDKDGKKLILSPIEYDFWVWN